MLNHIFAIACQSLRASRAQDAVLDTGISNNSGVVQILDVCFVLFFDLYSPYSLL